MSEDKKNTDVELDNKVTEEEEWEDLERSPERKKIFKTGLYYLLGILILAFPLYLLAKVLGKATGVAVSVYAIIFYILILIPAYRIWKMAQKEIAKHEDYGYDGALKFPFYTGMIGTTGMVTLAFVGLFTGFIWLIKPSPYNATIGYANGKKITVKTFLQSYIAERPTIRPFQLQRIFGKISFDDFKKITLASPENIGITEAEMKKKYQELRESEEEPNRSLIFGELTKFLLRQSILLEAELIAKQDATFQNLLNTGVLFETINTVSRGLNFQNVFHKQKTYKPVITDLPLVENLEKFRDELSYQRILIFNRNHRNDAVKAKEQADKAVAAIKGGLAWDKAFVQFNQRVGNRPAAADEIHKIDRNRPELAEFFNKPVDFVSEPIKFSFGYMIIKVKGTKKLTDAELLQNDNIVNSIKNKYLEKFQAEYEKMLKDRYQNEVKVNVNLLLGNKDSNEHFLVASNEVFIPVSFFWKNLNEGQKAKFSTPAGKREMEEYIQKSYVQPVMAYLEGKRSGLMQKDYVKYELAANRISVYIQGYINWYAVPKMVEPVVAAAGESALKEFYNQNAQQFAAGGPSAQNPYARAPQGPVKPYEALDAETKAKVVSSFKNKKMREVLMPHITQKLFPKFGLKVVKKYFVGKVPPARLDEFAASN